MTEMDDTIAGTVTDGRTEAGAASGAAASPSVRRRRFVHVASLVVILLAALVTFVPGIASLPITDRDEALFVQASRQMVESGNWIDIRVQDEPRYKKPIGIYWLQGLSAELSGRGADAPIVAYRMPSLIGAIAAVLFTYGIGATFGGPAAGLVAGLLATVVLDLGLEARLAKTDGVLLATVMAAEYALARLYGDPGRRRLLSRNALFWAAIGIGILVKGPITPLVAGLTLVMLSIFERTTAFWRALSPLKGIAFVLLLVSPWLVAIGWISHGAFFTQSIGRDMLGKVASGQQSHGAPPGTHLLVAIATFWPLSAFVPLAVAWAWNRRRLPVVRFTFAWVVPGWVIFELIATKLPNYVLPFMPALAVLAGAAIATSGLRNDSRWYRLGYAYVAVAAVLLALGLNCGFVVVEGYASPAGLVVGIAVCVAGLIAWRRLVSGHIRSGLAATVVTAAGLYGLAYGVLLPSAGQLWLSDRLAEAVAETKSCPSPETIVVGYGEPSVVFRLGTATKRTDAQTGAKDFLAADCAVAVVEDTQVGPFLSALSGSQVAPVRLVEGRNFNGFKRRTLELFVKP